MTRTGANNRAMIITPDPEPPLVVLVRHDSPDDYKWCDHEEPLVAIATFQVICMNCGRAWMVEEGDATPPR